MSEQSRSQHIFELAKELLDDIELNRLDAEYLLLKVTRLARLVGSDEVRQWLKYELSGYSMSVSDEISLKYLGLTGRWTDETEEKAYSDSLAQIEAYIEVQKLKLNVLSIPNMGGDNIVIAIDKVNRTMSLIASNIETFTGIKSRVLANLHSFISDIYYEKVFDELSASIFEKYQEEVDYLIADSCGDILEKIPIVMDRLAEGDVEAVSQALLTCRRIIETFSDAVFPPQNGTFELGGNQVSLDAAKHQNRLNVYVFQRTDSKSRQKRLRQNLSNLFDRVSTGVHNDVTVEEAHSLFFNTYMIIGEILQLDDAKM